jgi:hypothetical protein
LMPDNKKHHYVPKFYLRNFSLKNGEKNIGIFNIPNKKFISSGAIKNQAYKDYFYGKDGNAEKALGFIESKSSKIIREIVNTKLLPVKRPESYQMLLLFLVILNARTIHAEERLNDSINNLFKHVLSEVSEEFNEELKDESLRIGLENAVHLAIKTAALVAPITFDLDCKLICNKTQSSFITSDNPVVLYNQFLESRRPGFNNIGFVTKGLKILFPLSPSYCLVFFDGDVYKVGEKNTMEVEIKSSADVESMNRLQYINAQKNLYFNGSVSSAYLTKLISSSLKYRGVSKVELREISNTVKSKKRHILLHQKLTEERCGLQLSFVKVLKKAKKIQIDPNSPVIYRNERVARLERTLDRLQPNRG